MTFDDHVNDKDLSNERVFDLGTNKIRVIRTDPYGFWHISFERGQLPKKLKGNYTSFDQAEKAVRAYLTEREREIKSIKQ